MKNKKIFISLIVIVLIVMGVASYFMFFNSKQIESIEIDKKDHTYVLKNINDNYLFQIYTTHNDYDIYDIDGHKIDVVKEYSNSILTIQSKDNYKDNKTYVIRLKDKDSFVDEKLKNARIIYFGTNEALTKEKLNYEVTKLNIKDSYTLQDNKIRLGDLTAQLSIELLNKNIDLKLKEYQAFIDDKKMKTSSIKATKGKHKIKIQFNYDDKKYEYEKEVNIKELFGGLSDKEILKKCDNAYQKLLDTYSQRNIKTSTKKAFKEKDITYYEVISIEGKKVTNKTEFLKVVSEFMDPDLKWYYPDYDEKGNPIAIKDKVLHKYLYIYRNNKVYVSQMYKTENRNRDSSEGGYRYFFDEIHLNKIYKKNFSNETVCCNGIIKLFDGTKYIENPMNGKYLIKLKYVENKFIVIYCDNTMIP